MHEQHKTGRTQKGVQKGKKSQGSGQNGAIRMVQVFDTTGTVPSRRAADVCESLWIRSYCAAFSGSACMMHPDVRDVKLYARFLSYALLQIHGHDLVIGHFCHYSVKSIPQNSSGPSASGKILETFQASFIVTAQTVADPVWAASLDVGSLVHGHVAHANHAYRNHPGPNLVIFSCLYIFSSSSSLVPSLTY